SSSLPWTAGTSSRAAKKRSVSTEASIGSVSGLPATVDRRQHGRVVLRECLIQDGEVGVDRRLTEACSPERHQPTAGGQVVMGRQLPQIELVGAALAA